MAWSRDTRAGRTDFNRLISSARLRSAASHRTCPDRTWRGLLQGDWQNEAISTATLAAPILPRCATPSPPSLSSSPLADRLVPNGKGAFDEVLMIHGRDVQVRGAGETVRAITVEELRPEFRCRYASAETDGDKAAATIRQALKRALSACPRHGFKTAAWNGEEWLWRA